jgi:hypothetical protein
MLPSTPGFSKWSLASGFRTKTLFLSPICAICPAHRCRLFEGSWLPRLQGSSHTEDSRDC